MDFGKKVLLVRAKLNLTQAQLGNKLHVTMGTVSRWEANKVKPTKKAECAFEQLCKENNIIINELK